MRMDMSGTEVLGNEASGDVLMSFVMPSKFTKVGGVRWCEVGHSTVE